MTITNLTPHPIRIYGWGVPDRIDPADHEVPFTLEPSGTVARIGEIELGTQTMRGVPVPVEYVEFHHVNGLPPVYENYDDNTEWYVVSLALALQMVALPRDRGGRNDLLVPFREVRNLDGTVIGCRSLALPV
jgi:hypothetical protein